MRYIDDVTVIVRNIGNNLLMDYQDDGAIYSGINGPYNDQETRVRNLAHLIIIASVEVNTFHNNEYAKILHDMGEELCGLCEDDGYYIMRQKESKDSCNGVIGNAWVLEGLYYLYSVYKEEKYICLMRKIISLHQYNDKIGLWSIPREYEKIDYTLNHQLWFVASLIEVNTILNDKRISGEINSFMKKLVGNFEVNKIGRIHHSIVIRPRCTDLVKQRIKKVLLEIYESVGKPSMKYKEEGYHIFNLMALARIYDKCPKYDFFNSASFHKAIEYVNSEVFFDGLLDQRVDLDISLNNDINNEDEKCINIYGYPYNVPGFEIMYINDVLKDTFKEDVVGRCVNQQISLLLDEKGLLTKCCYDKKTINYRVYEYYRYLERHS